MGGNHFCYHYNNDAYLVQMPGNAPEPKHWQCLLLLLQHICILFITDFLFRYLLQNREQLVTSNPGLKARFADAKLGASGNLAVLGFCFLDLLGINNSFNQEVQTFQQS